MKLSLRGWVLFFVLTSTSLSVAAPLRQDQGGTGTATFLPKGSTVVSDGQKYIGDMRSLNAVTMGAKCDVAYGLTFAITAGANILSSPGIVFTAADVGKYVLLPGHGANGTTLHTTITSISGTNAVLAHNSAVGAGKVFLQDANMDVRGYGYVPGQTITLAGGTGSVATVVTVRTTAVSVAIGLPTIVAGGSGGKDGSQQVYGTTGSGNRVVLNVTISGGALTAINSIADAGHYTANPTNINDEPVAGFQLGLTGARVAFQMGVDLVEVTTPGIYNGDGIPTNPMSQASTSGSGIGAEFSTLPRFNTQMFVYGTDDSAVLNTLLSQSNVTITLPARACGVASTLQMTGERTRFIGEGASKLPVGAEMPGTTLQWLGAENGTMMVAEPTADQVSVFNQVSGMTFLCAINRNTSGGYVPVASTGLKVAGQDTGTFSNLAFASCREQNILATARSILWGSIRSLFSNIFMVNGLAYDGIGIFVTGMPDPAPNATAGACTFDTIASFYKNRAAIQIVAADANHLRLPLLQALPNALPNIFGVDISGGVYGTTEPTNHAFPLQITWAAADVIMRGLESTPLPPQLIQLHTVEPVLGTSPYITQRPGSGSVSYDSWNGRTRMAGPLMVGNFINEDLVPINKPRVYIAGNEQAELMMSDTRTSGNQIGKLVYESAAGGAWTFQKVGDGGSTLNDLLSITQNTGGVLARTLEENVGVAVSRAGNGSLSLVPETGANYLNPITPVDSLGLFYSGPTAGTAPPLVIAPWAVASGGMVLGPTGNVGFGTATPTHVVSIGGDTDRTIFMERNSVADTAGNSLTIRAGGATGNATNKLGGSLVLASGWSTGNQASRVNISTSVPAASGTTTNEMVNRAVFGSFFSLTSGAPTTVATVTTGAGQGGGGTISYSIYATDGTDVLQASGQVAYALVNKAGVRTGATSILGTEAVAKSDVGDSISNVWDFSAEALRLTPTLTGMTATTFNVTYSVTANSSQNVTSQ